MNEFPSSQITLDCFKLKQHKHHGEALSHLTKEYGTMVNVALNLMKIDATLLFY